MNVFYTITAENTQFCNDRSKRFGTLDEAIKGASDRLASGSGIKAVVIMKAIKIVTPKVTALPVQVNDLEEHQHASE